MVPDSSFRSCTSASNQFRSDAFSSTTYQPLGGDHALQQPFMVPRKPIPSQKVSRDEPHSTEKSVPKVIPIPSRRRIYVPFFEALRCWVPELLASLFSIVALLAIVVVLRIYDGRSIEDLNLPRSLTLNGLIAAIATFDRVFLVIPVGSALSQEAWLWFAKNDGRAHPRSRLRDLDRSDAASRGAWGSFMFVFTSPHRYLSLVGAVITLLSLAITTFTQQLIVVQNTPLQDRASPLQPGNLPRSEFYDLYTGSPSEGILSVTLSMTAAVYNGLMAANIEPVQATCPSGNCSWPTTPSLAVCGGCAPIFPIHTRCNSTACNFTMPSGSVFELTNFTAAANEGTGFQTMPSSGQHWNTSIIDHLYLTNFDMMGAPYGSYGGEARFDNMLNASECALWMCINMYSTSDNAGTQTQDIVSSFYEIHYEPGIEIVNYTFEYPNTANGADLGSYTNYTVSDFAWAALSEQFNSGGPGFISMVDGSVFLNTNTHIASSDVTNAIWAGSGDRGKWIQNLATSMSNIVRTAAQTPREVYAGTAYVQGVHVQWWWMSLPIAAVASSILLLLVVMVRTARSPLGAWRGSPLTLLLCEVDEDIKRAVEDTTLGKGIDPGVGGRKVTLRRIDGGFWKFESHPSSLT